MTITLTNIIVPIPPKLTLTSGIEVFNIKPYEFTASSRTRSGQLRPLDPVVYRDRPDPDDD